MRVLIAGGGIGGLATAIALGDLGMDCLILEQSTQANESAAGLILWSNAVKALRFLGVEDQVEAKGSVIKQFAAVSAGERILARLDLAEIGRDAGAVSICVLRAELLKILSGKLRPGTVRSGARCVSFAVRGSAVIIHMADGSTRDGDVLIGADGIQSAVRAQLLGDEPPRYAGCTSWRGIAEGDWLPPGTATTVIGHGEHAWLFPCGPNRVYWFYVRNAPARANLDLAALGGKLPKSIARAVAATPRDEILRNDIVDRPPSANWGHGPMTLLGDAAHATAPYLGQGACQALEDAWALGTCLGTARPVEESLRAYEQRRMSRTAMVTSESTRVGRILQTDNAFGMGMRDLAAVTPFGRHWAGNLFRQLLCG